MLLRAVLANQCAIIASALLLAACGRVGFATSADATGDIDGHLHTATGWSIAQLVDLGAGFSYVQQDFVDGDGSVVRDNAPSYVAALYPPFTAELAVITGRSVIEIAADGHMTSHDYRPMTPDAGGPDAPGRMTYADFGSGDAALWLTSSSVNGGDGLYRIASNWSMQAINHTNNVYALVFDAGGTFDARTGPILYFAAERQLERQVSGAATPVNTTLPPSVDDLAVVGDALYLTAETQTQVLLDRLGPGTSYLQSQLSSSTSTDLALAEGPADAALFAIHDDGGANTSVSVGGAASRAGHFTTRWNAAASASVTGTPHTRMPSQLWLTSSASLPRAKYSKSGAMLPITRHVGSRCSARRHATPGSTAMACAGVNGIAVR